MIDLEQLEALLGVYGTDAVRQRVEEIIASHLDRAVVIVQPDGRSLRMTDELARELVTIARSTKPNFGDVGPRKHNLIKAIKHMRSVMGADLRTAKFTVESLCMMDGFNPLPWTPKVLKGSAWAGVYAKRETEDDVRKRGGSPLTCVICEHSVDYDDAVPYGYGPGNPEDWPDAGPAHRECSKGVGVAE